MVKKIKFQKRKTKKKINVYFIILFFTFLGLLITDIFIPDPLPVIDEVILALLTGLMGFLNIRTIKNVKKKKKKKK